MYNIRSLNIWKENNRYRTSGYRMKVLEADVSKRKETDMCSKCRMVFREILKLVPNADFVAIKSRRCGKLRFPVYINEKLRTTDLEILELSMRSNNCLHRAGFKTLGEVVEAIECGEDLRKIRNCGTKSIDEIIEKLFCYQYLQIEPAQRVKYINRVLELNC